MNTLATLDRNRLTPYTVGFDSLFDRLFDTDFHTTSGGFPPYNIVRNDDYNYQIEMALAGYSKKDIDIELKEGNLTISSKKLEEEIDENGDSRIRRFTRPKLQIIVGPYWPMLFCVTYPLILGVSGLTLYTRIPYLPPLVGFVWFVLTVALIVALAMTAFRDPGILPRHENPPNNDWRWSDRTYSYKPRKAYYDPDTGVVVEGFDHTCPWTGTAIGKKNYGAFCCFVALIFVCLILNIILLTGGAASAIRNY